MQVQQKLRSREKLFFKQCPNPKVRAENCNLALGVELRIHKARLQESARFDKPLTSLPAVPSLPSLTGKAIGLLETRFAIGENCDMETDSEKLVTVGFDEDISGNAREKKKPSWKTTKKPNRATQRYQRYKTVIDLAVGRSRFELDDIKSEFANENPGFITRIVNELEKKGWIVAEATPESKTKAYRWNSSRSFSVSKWLDDKLFGTQLKGSPEQERPREKLLSKGAEHLATSELIAILIRCGLPGESAVVGGQNVSKAFDGRLEDLPSAGRAELKDISRSVGMMAYCQIMAGVELGRRVAALSDKKITNKIGSSGEAIQFCQAHFARLIVEGKQEEFHIITLDTKNQVIDTHCITVGTLDASLVHPREVFRAAIKDAASSIILVHNHPSGDPTPSREDIAVTQRLTESGKMIGIDVLDHVVLGRSGPISIQETI